MGTSDRLEFGLRTFLRDVLQSEQLELGVRSIIESAEEKGLSGLSRKETQMFEKEVIEKFGVQRCSSCEGPIPWEEMYATRENQNLCIHCQHTFLDD